MSQTQHDKNSSGGPLAPHHAAEIHLRHIMGELRLSGRRRLEGFEYRGVHAYHVAMVANFRRSLLVGAVAARAQRQLLISSERHDFEILSYVVMPDHLHVLCSGQTDASDLVRCVQHFKQATGYEYKQAYGSQLWQQSFYDRIVRRDEDAHAMARYIVENPVRAGLVADPGAWPYAGGTLVQEEARRPNANTSGAKAPPLLEDPGAEPTS
jgi:REP element-mobilizing transposase RayT